MAEEKPILLRSADVVNGFISAQTATIDNLERYITGDYRTLAAENRRKRQKEEKELVTELLG